MTANVAIFQIHLRSFLTYSNSLAKIEIVDTNSEGETRDFI